MKAQLLALSLFFVLTASLSLSAKFVVVSVSPTGDVTRCDAKETPFKRDEQVLSTEGGSKFSLKFKKSTSKITIYDTRYRQTDGAYARWEITAGRVFSASQCVVISIKGASADQPTIKVSPVNSARVRLINPQIPKLIKEPTNKVITAPTNPASEPTPAKKNDEEEPHWEVILLQRRSEGYQEPTLC